MTGARRQQKPKICSTVAAAVAASVLAGAAWAAGTSGVTLTTLIVTDPLTGLALNGFDPVAYFTDRRPRPGEGDYELTYGGVVWRFCNEGNQAAFARDPKIYMPSFGGYDPVEVARGLAVPGNPLIWLIADNRLYVFNSSDSRKRFAGDPEQSLAAAADRWPEVEQTLVP